MKSDFRYRQLRKQDEPFLWEMLYQAVYVPPGENPPPREIVNQPELARYVQGWGRADDLGWLAIERTGALPAGAAWLRLLNSEQHGYGYVNECTPEISLAVLPGYRGRGAGTELLARLIRSSQGRFPALSLSVSSSNPAVHLYERVGFRVIKEAGGSLTMKLDISG
jgi:ribosomal protein S18 acetylase RimI-like enzyme